MKATDQSSTWRLLKEVASTPSASSPWSPGDAHILLAEDSPLNQRLCIEMLRLFGYQADIASNGHEVLEALARKPYRLILMDCQMPGMDGYEATRKIRESEAATRPPVRETA
ncbi:MAG: response regulator [Syntrophobacteraceae bacterium]